MLPKSQQSLESAASLLKSNLGENLWSLVAYGSAVRGNFVDGVSDLNLLLILNQSTALAHQAIARIVLEHSLVEPMVIGRKGMQRTMEVFALKFMSIKRNYKLLHGTDPFSELSLNPSLVRFLCEQAIRNSRLRLVHAFITMGGDRKAYSGYLQRRISSIFVDLSEVPRILGKNVPNDFRERVPLLEETFGTKLGILPELLKLKASPRVLSESECFEFHSGLFETLNHVVFWIEEQWKLPTPAGAGS
jgi:hypothetical protein